MTERVAVGPGYRWSTYELDGQEHVAAYLNRGDLVGLVRHDRRGWYVMGDGTRRLIPDALVDELRGTAPDDYPVIPEQVGLVVPVGVDVDSAGYMGALDAVVAEIGVTGPDAWKMAAEVTGRIRFERTVTIARRIVGDERLVRDAGLDDVVALSVATILDAPRVPRVPLFGQLLAEGHNATVVARWKVGKSTFIDNAMMAAAAGSMFLGSFECPAPLRVALFNYELHDDDMAERLHALAMPAHVADNIVVVNLRGRRLPLTTAKGRDVTVRILDGIGANVWLLDPFGAAFAGAGGEDENSNAEVRRFLIALDEIKRMSGCASMLMPVHTGRRNDAEGDEQGRGATVLEDWPDVRMLLTKDKSQIRYLRTEGRAWELGESRLSFDETTRHLTLAMTDIGVGRHRARIAAAALAVTEIVYEFDGITKTELRDALGEVGIARTDDKDEAIAAARAAQTIHVHRTGRNVHRHYLGAQHADADRCSGGFTNQT